MLPASTTATGQCVATAPDVCKTPTPGGPVPIPYPNIAMVMQAINTSTKVMIVNRPALHVMSKIPMSSGDEGGTAGGGVVSSMIKGEAKYTMGSVKVMIEGKQSIRHTDMTTHNGANANIVGNQPVPSQAKVMVGP